jgi:uncharacterized lipoprotein YddW (UPF0748 family)
VKFKLVTILTTLVIGLLFPLWAQTDNEEFRATWVITWEHISGSSSAAENMARVDKILDNHQKANMNAVLFQVRQGGTAYYNSSYEPWGYYAGYQDPGYDPLAYAVQEAHKRGMEVHAWFNVFQTSSTIDGTPVAEHPEWVCRDASGNAMTDSRCISPGLEAVRKYSVDVAMEIVNNYDIDGLHLDYVRWNEYSSSKIGKSYARQAEEENWLDGMITDEQIEDLKTNKGSRYLYDVEHPYSAGVPTGFSSWADWWRWSVTEFVHTLHDSIQAVKPWVRLSVAALGKYRWSDWQGYGSVYQDAALWFNEGYVDQLTPMSYHWTTADGFVTMLSTGGSQSWGYWIQDGISDGRLFSVGPGSYILDENNIWDRHPSIINACRNISWVDGFQFFSYASWNSNLYWEEAGSTFFGKKTKIRTNPVINSAAPSAPAIAIQKINDLNYQLTVTPSDVSQGQWYAIYRSTDNVIDVTTDEIIAVRFGNASFDYSDAFSGNQDYNHAYHYAATTLNRYWKESTPSPVVASEAIPSYPPVITSHSPLDQATAPANSYITITFSKTIATATFENALTISPAIDYTVTWASDNKTVTIKPSESLAFSTTYTVTLNPTLTDINGSALDGNSDGTAGDEYSFSFTTYDIDLTGPQAESSYPDLTSGDLDIDAPISIIFDEIIEAATVNSNSITLINDGRSYSIEPVINNVNNRSVLTVRPYAQLKSDVENSLVVSSSVTDTLGNPMASSLDLNFHTANYYYPTKTVLDDFTGSGSWWDPEGSGSTKGTVGAATTFSYSTTCYTPGTTFDATKKKAGCITYKWDTSASLNLLRDHIEITSAPATIHIDTSYTIQCYLFGDGSQNEFNFSLYEYNSSGSTTSDIIEVGPWQTIDWIGWRLVEWDLGDTNIVGDFISANRNMDGAYYRLDGLLIRKTNPAADSCGQVFVDELRIVKRTEGQPPENSAPVLTSVLRDTFVTSGSQIRVKPTYTDANATDTHEFVCLSDTAAVYFKINGHTSGSTIYVKTVEGYVGTAFISIIVRDFGVGELADTSSFYLTVNPASGIDSELLPERLELSQNYPNPFNPITIIKFNLPQTARVTLEVYDLLGKRVTELINADLEYGSHSFVFDGSDLPSGQYFYRLVTGEKVLTRKMVLMK